VNNVFVIETSPFSLYQKDIDDLVDMKLCVSYTSLEKLFYKYPELRKSPQKYGYLYNPLDIDHLRPYILTEADRISKRKLLGIQDSTIVL
jgi:DNA transposition AAA+ family ATPase